MNNIQRSLAIAVQKVVARKAYAIRKQTSRTIQEQNEHIAQLMYSQIFCSTAPTVQVREIQGLKEELKLAQSEIQHLKETRLLFSVRCEATSPEQYY